jgi:hypothetical protein
MMRLDGSIAECRLIVALNLFVNVRNGNAAVSSVVLAAEPPQMFDKGLTGRA